MANIEAESFFIKFRYLWSAGYHATLTIEAVDGKASVLLRSELGVFDPPAPRHYPPPPRYRGPAYRRRQEKRKAATAAKVADDEAVQAYVPDDVDVVAAVEACEHDNQAEEAEEDNTKTTEKVEYSCELCDFKSNWENGLRIHMTRKHSQIEQLDGNLSVVNEELYEDEKYADTEKYWKTGILSTVYQSFLDANEIVDGSDLIEKEKEDEKAKILEARKCAFGDEFKYYPPWRQR